MTKLVEKAFSEVSKLSDQEQDAIAGWLLDELASERRWEKSLSTSSSVLEVMAREAIVQYKAGQTTELDPDKL